MLISGFHFYFYGFALLFIFFIHELGHYLAGLAAGIPRTKISFLLKAFPQWVRLWNGKEWILPLDYRFVETYNQYDSEGIYCYRFLSSGIALETISVVLLSYILSGLGFPSLAFSLLFMSLIVGSCYLVLDLYISHRKGSPWGDITRMAALSLEKTVMNTFLCFVLRLSYMYLLSSL